jgi:Sap, sulfolipid-1-addressing protein
VLVVLTSGRGRLNGTAFAIGFVAGQATICLLALTVGSWSPLARTEHHAELQSALAIAFGIALLIAAAYFRRHRNKPLEPAEPSRRTRAVRQRLSTLRPLTALGTGAALGIGGPKRLGVTLVVTATITAAGVREVEQFALATAYVLVGTVLVWLPVLLYIVFGDRGATWLTDGQAWIAAHKDPLTFYPSAVLGVVLIADGIIQLTA